MARESLPQLLLSHRPRKACVCVCARACVWVGGWVGGWVGVGKVGARRLSRAAAVRIRLYL